MTLDEFLAKRKFIKDVQDRFSKEINSPISNPFGKAEISQAETMHIALCLDWLEQIFEERYQTIGIYQMDIPDKVADDMSYKL